MIACLPMYWQPGNAAAWRRLWADIRDSLPDLPPLTDPAELSDDLFEHWQAPDLVLSQTCGLPFCARLWQSVSYIGTIDFALPDTPPGFYHSVVVTRRNEDRDDTALRLAYNAADSQSGWGAAQGRIYAGYLCTGAHRLSAMAVADGTADIAAIDAVTWRLLRAFDAAVTDRLTIRRRTPPTVGLPLIAAQDTDPGPLRLALQQALGRLSADDRRLLGGPVALTILHPEDYRALHLPPPPPA